MRQSEFKTRLYDRLKLYLKGFTVYLTVLSFVLSNVPWAAPETCKVLVTQTLELNATATALTLSESLFQDETLNSDVMFPRIVAQSIGTPDNP